MKIPILKIANKKFKKLQARYNGFINIIVDDWRGYRFIFDSVDVRKCRNNCATCPLYKFLKKEKCGVFSAGLFRASTVDKKLFGKQNFLNCKTLTQYRDCYINWLVFKINTEKELKNELDLVSNLRIIFTKNGNNKNIEKKFKRSIIRKACLLSRGKKKAILKAYYHNL